jgi:hypothetical protein
MPLQQTQVACRFITVAETTDAGPSAHISATVCQRCCLSLRGYNTEQKIQDRMQGLGAGEVAGTCQPVVSPVIMTSSNSVNTQLRSDRAAGCMRRNRDKPLYAAYDSKQQGCMPGMLLKSCPQLAACAGAISGAVSLSVAPTKWRRMSAAAL